ncbi:MAG: PIN domain-containing protein [Kiritimatiellae bacterium]|nr:PIN domain-containing protein [Kiritimatiellia bacterium]
MSKMLLPDTNVLIDVLNGSRQKLRRELAADAQVGLSLFVEGEFRAGLSKTARGLASERALDDFIGLPNVVQLAPTSPVAKRYGEILHLLLSKGRPIPTNDIWIAAHAMELGATVVTADPHFKEIPLLDMMLVE